MGYFQAVVTEYLRAKRSRFVNTEYMINLDLDGTYKKDRHWYCDAVAIDFADSSVHLCEITYSKTLHSVCNRLQFWCNHWPEVVKALRRDSELTDNWKVAPRVFVPVDLVLQLRQRISSLKRPGHCSDRMPDPIVTPLEEVLPWKYRSWNGKPFAEETD
jgi:hypothetical protein